MRKLIVILLALGLFVAFVGSACAESALNPASDYTELRVYTCILTNGDGTAISAGADAAVGGNPLRGGTFGWAIPTSSIRAASSKIVGWSLLTNSVDTDGSLVGAMASLHDLSAATTNHLTAEQGMSNTTLFAEAEVTTADPKYEVWFPYPKKLVTQLGVMIEADTGAILNIYYIR